MISGCSFPTSIPPALTQVTMKAMAFGLLAVASANEANPIEKLAQMMADLQDKIYQRG